MDEDGFVSMLSWLDEVAAELRESARRLHDHADELFAAANGIEERAERMVNEADPVAS